MKPLIITPILGRPQTTKRCFESLLEHTQQEEFEWVIVDQDSTPEVKRWTESYHPDYRINRDFNSGIVFGINEAIALYRKPGQDIIKLDDDVLIESHDWLESFIKVLSSPKFGSCLGRRPTFFIDDPSRFSVYINMPKEEINGIWVEIATIGLVGCWWMIKGEVIDKIGYLNEATQNDDYDFWYRMKKSGWESCYIPDAVCKQYTDEPITHPSYGIHKKMVRKCQMFQNAYTQMYEKDCYIGTRFRIDDWLASRLSYLGQSNKNYVEFKRCELDGF